MSLVMLIAGLGLLFYVLWMNKKQEGCLIGSVKGDPYGITKFIGDTKDEMAYKDNFNMMCKIYPENYPEKPAENEKNQEETSAENEDEGAEK